MKQILLIVFCLACFSFSSKLQKRSIRDKQFDIECYISSKPVNSFKANKMYYWYRSGKIHKSISASGGFVLHKEFKKYYKTNQLAEQGEFMFGLKQGEWKTWHENGMIKTKEYWDYGYREWEFVSYDSTGNLILKGSYNNNKKTGKWINYNNGDTTYYKNDLKLKEKPTTIIQRVLHKKDSLEKLQKKLKRITKRKSDSLKKVSLKTERLLKRKNDSLKRANLKAERVLKRKNDSIEKAKAKQVRTAKKSLDSFYQEK